MSFLRPATQSETTVPLPRPQYGWLARGRSRGEGLIAAAAARPYIATLRILILNAVLAAACVGLGHLLFADSRELFRELMPATLVSFLELLFLAAVAWTINVAVAAPNRPRVDNLWGLSAVVFLVFAVDEITQATIFLADLLAAAGALAPAGFKDLDAFLLVILFLAAGLVLLRHAGEVLAHPPALALLCIGVLLGMGSQTLDSLLPATEQEFVAEESLKLAAEAFLIGGYLVVLHRVTRRSAEPAHQQPGRV